MVEPGSVELGNGPINFIGGLTSRTKVDTRGCHMTVGLTRNFRFSLVQ